MDEILKRDQNFVTVLAGVTDDADQDITMLRVDSITKRLLVKATGGGSGTVTNVTSNDGSINVTNPTTTPDLSVVSAPKLTTGRTISITGDLAYTSPSFDGSGNVTAAGTLATVNSNVGSFTYASITVNAKGLVTAASNGTAAVTSVSGTANRITSTGGTTPVIDISASYVGQSSITTLGTITTGVWQGTKVGLAYGGTNADLSATGGSSQVLKQTSVGGAITVAQLAASDLSNGVTGSGAVVLATSPTLTTAALGSSTATTQIPGDNSTKVATTAFVANAVLGQDFKEACKYATTAALPAIVYNNGSSGVGATLTAVSFGALSLDGSTPSIGDRILVKNQVSTFQNGIYTVTVVGAVATLFVLTRAIDFDQSTDIATGDSVFITSGSTQSTTTWAYNGIDAPVMGTDAITFAQTAGQGSFTAGNGIAITGVSIAIDTSITVDKTTAQTLTNKTLTAPILTTPVLGTPSSGTLTNCTGLPAASVVAGTFGTGAYVMDTSLTVPQIFNIPNAITASGNAATVTRANRNNVVTNNSASGLTITLSTSGASAGDMIKIKSLPSSNVAQTITWVNTENSDVTPSANLNASTTSPRTDGFEWNPLTSKWRCIASC